VNAKLLARVLLIVIAEIGGMNVLGVVLVIQMEFVA
jgi:hypothetical protein